MDRDKYHDIISKISEVRANCDSRPGDRRGSGRATPLVDETHGLVLLRFHNISCEDCDKSLDWPRSREFIWRTDRWIERCGVCLLIRDPVTGKMVKPRAAKRRSTGKDGPVGTWPDPPELL